MKLSTLRMLTLVFTASLIAALAISAQLPAQEQKDVARSAQHPTIITFDPPGSILTQAVAINPAGAIAGTFFDASNKIHGFVRAKDGTFTKFDSPDAGTGAFQGTTVQSINPAGAITGWVYSNSGAHSYVRAPDGTFTTFDVPGALATQALNINPEGAIAGQFLDLNQVFQGFLRAPDGTFTTFDAPGAGTGVGQGTQTSTVDGLNPEGAIAVAYVNTGSFFSGTQVLHGAVRAPDGKFTEFDVPGAGTGSGQGTVVASINTPGDFDGWYIDGSGVAHGFLRSKHGGITTFDVLGAGTASGQGTFRCKTTRRTLSRDSTLTRTMCFTASCGND